MNENDTSHKILKRVNVLALDLDDVTIAEVVEFSLVV